MDSPDLRKGKWTPEEEDYANRVITLFNQGLLNIAPGTTLRAYLSEKLQCDPMRITKKYAGQSSIGKQLYQPCDNFLTDSTIIALVAAGEEELQILELRFQERIAGKKSLPRSGSRQRLSLTPSKAVDASPEVSVHGTETVTVKGREGVKREAVPAEAASSSGSVSASQLHAPSLLSLPISGTSRPRNVLSRYKRVYSAPNLSLSHFNGEGHSERDRESYDDSLPLEQSKRSRFGEREGPAVSLAKGGTGNTASGWRRSKSVMAFMDFEKLASDEQAAGDLFLEFISSLRSPVSTNTLNTGSSGDGTTLSSPRGCAVSGTTPYSAGYEYEEHTSNVSLSTLSIGDGLVHPVICASTSSTSVRRTVSFCLSAAEAKDNERGTERDGVVYVQQNPSSGTAYLHDDHNDEDNFF